MDTVMIVDDDDKVRGSIKSMILKSNVDINAIIECGNGKIALDVLKKQKVDIIFSDIHMPIMDGLTLVKEIKKLNISPIIVVVSESDNFDMAVELMRNNVKDYILKPICNDDIINIMIKFENEIIKSNIKQEQINRLYIQQLKYLLINDNILDNEIDNLANNFNDIFFDKEYLVICLNNYNKNIDNKKVILLKNVDNNDVLIIDKSIKYNILKDELEDYYVGISKAYVGINNLKRAYIESKNMRKQAFMLCKKVVEANDSESLFTSIIKKSDNVLIAVQKMGTDKKKETIDIINHFIKNVKMGKYSYDIFYETIEKFTNSVITTYKSVIDDITSDVVKKNFIATYQNIDDYKNDLIEWINVINEMIVEQFDDYKNKQKVKNAISFIDENYNKCLNMAVVSNYINMNYSLFSYSFKQYTGMNFVNYLKEKRIKEAKRLLEETELHINEISKEVGYDNEKHFMKTFKNMCGVSPSKYRKNISLKKAK